MTSFWNGMETPIPRVILRYSWQLYAFVAWIWKQDAELSLVASGPFLFNIYLLVIAIYIRQHSILSLKCRILGEICAAGCNALAWKAKLSLRLPRFWGFHTNNRPKKEQSSIYHVAFKYGDRVTDCKVLVCFLEKSYCPCRKTQPWRHRQMFLIIWLKLASY